MTIGNFRATFIREISNYDLPEREGLLRIILEETLGVSAITAMMHNDQEIPHEKTLELKAVCEQLAHNIPIQYIYQKASFFGLDLYEAGLGEQIEGMVKELYAGKGAVRATLHQYVSER